MNNPIPTFHVVLIANLPTMTQGWHTTGSQYRLSILFSNDVSQLKKGFVCNDIFLIKSYHTRVGLCENQVTIQNVYFMTH